MPSISMFYGMTIYMYRDDHNPPHFHVKYQGKTSSFDLDGNIKEGELPVAKQALVRAWAIIHKEDLLADWDLCMNDEAVYKIEPLK